jgi:hypothetical protein
MLKEQSDIDASRDSNLVPSSHVFLFELLTPSFALLNSLQEHLLLAH